MTDAPPVDRERIIEVLRRHGVEYLLVGGGAAQIYGAERPTQDTDCLARRTRENLDRLASAMRELGARLRVEGLSDDEASELPIRVDADMLATMEISTWTTDAGWFDVLNDIPAGDGHRLRYDDLVGRAVIVHVGGVEVSIAALSDIIASKEWADRPKDHEALPELRRLASEL